MTATTTEMLARAHAQNSAQTETEAVENAPEGEGIISTLMNAKESMPATVAQQIFSVIPGIAGGLAGFLLAAKLANVKRVSTKGVLLAGALNAVLTFATIYLIVEHTGEKDE